MLLKELHSLEPFAWVHSGLPCCFRPVVDTSSFGAMALFVFSSLQDYTWGLPIETETEMFFILQPPPAITDKQLDEREHTVEEWKGETRLPLFSGLFAQQSGWRADCCVVSVSVVPPMLKHQGCLQMVTAAHPLRLHV